MFTIGSKGQAETIVTAENTAKSMGSGDLLVYATPSMVALMESAARNSVQNALPPGTGTVGTLMNVKHLTASPIHMKITAESERLEEDGRRLVFRVCASDEQGLIGEGIHERFIIDNEKFMAKANGKLG
ncbi:MAG: thioesterase family protein [Oscillospiraceae bacterium]